MPPCPAGKYPWEKLIDQQLLQQRLSRLRVAVEGTWLEDCISTLYEELEERGIRLRPHTWISSEWFSLADVPGIAIPFYLTHPPPDEAREENDARRRGRHLVRNAWPSSVYEAGHAIQHGAISCSAAGVGSSCPPVLKTLPALLLAQSGQPEICPASSAVVRAEPSGRGFRRNLRGVAAAAFELADALCAGWPALKKLEYVDELMEEIAGEAAAGHERERIDPLHGTQRETLGDYYKKRSRRSTPSGHRRLYDRDLSRLFSTGARVVVPLAQGCGVCDDCRTGFSNHCMRGGGMTGYAQYGVLSHADFNYAPLPEEIDFVEASSMGCRYVTAFHGLLHQGHVKADEIGRHLWMWWCWPLGGADRFRAGRAGDRG